jgi:hypothetical protein
VNCHEIDQLGRYKLGRAYEVALIFTIFVVDNYDHFAEANIFRGVFDTG